MDSNYAVTITGPSFEQLRALCRQILQARLAAAANIVPAATSLYWWQDELHETGEAWAILHTSEPALERIKHLVAQEHPYDVPQMVYWPIHSTDSYRAWITSESG